MNLRLDHLLEELRTNGADILRAIDADPLLVKRQSGALVLANAGAMLFTPQLPHQLFAKGIVYRRDPFELVSLPLVKIYNLGEKDVSAADLTGIVAEPGNARLHFLRKLDGTLLQRFQHDGRVYFTTRGMIEGGPCYGVQDEDTSGRAVGFDFLGTARRLAEAKYPALCEARPEFENTTLVFEFIHPETRVITNYGDREDLVLLACFDRTDHRYRTYAEVKALATAHVLAHVDEFTPAGNNIGEQIESLLAAIAGTDQEGTVITIEHGHRVVYRVKVKGPDYLRVLKLVVTCTYDRTVEMIDAHPHWTSWADVAAHLRSLGREQVPEEVLDFYREHYDVFAGYIANCVRLRDWAQVVGADLRKEAEAEAGLGNDRLLRKCFAARAVKLPMKPLLFAAFDGRLDIAVVRQTVRTPDEAKDAVATLPGTP
ncbi:RNA ligase [Gemmata sp. SH-PL17]|uniref:RNA ligase n=1 Tax=Gemmata sp. SH-PL17 TaxID=1630693 RepID=UPI00078EC88A|nr:RNA ligase [Gemmata sp. SH-PL17]AMV26598.1 RNA ligase [Gemmata sp. SH-PL17]